LSKERDMEAVFWAAFGLLAGALIPLTRRLTRRRRGAIADRKRVAALRAELDAAMMALEQTRERVARLEGAVDPRAPSRLPPGSDAEAKGHAPVRVHVEPLGDSQSQR
jgi:hypothetical protein